MDLGTDKVPISIRDEETTTELLKRLQSAKVAEPVKIFVDPTLEFKPALVPAGKLSGLSKWFGDALTNKSRDGSERTFRFGDTAPGAVEVFLYWLEMNAVPDLANTDSVTTVEEYRLLLSRAFVFAEDKRIRPLRNDLMQPLIFALRKKEMSLGVLQKVLLMAPRSSRIRIAILEEALYLEADGSELLEGLDLQFVSGFNHDTGCAKAAWEKRNGERGKARDYFVKE